MQPPHDSDLFNSYFSEEELNEMAQLAADLKAGLLPKGWCPQCWGEGRPSPTARHGVWIQCWNRDAIPWDMCSLCLGSGASGMNPEYRAKQWKVLAKQWKY